MSNPSATDPAFPLIHIGGSSGAALTEYWLAAARAADDAATAFRQIDIHLRDYIGNEDGYNQARLMRDGWVTTALAMKRRAEEFAMHCQDTDPRRKA